jgi:hypothetical protein
MNAPLLLAVVLAGAVAASAHPGAQRQDPGPKLPLEDEGACPFVGCMYGDWIAKSPAQAHTERRASAPVAFQVSAGETVSAVTGVVVVARSGRVGFRRTEILTTADGDLEIQAGQLLHLLISEGGGFWTAWFGGRVYRELDGGSFSSPGCKIEPSRCPANILAMPQAAWWVQMRNKQGQIGWTNETDKFDGKGTRN